MKTFDIKTFDLGKFDNILSRGLCDGVGIQGQQVCIEAAICETLGLPHGDDPGCVSAAVRSFKIKLNDSPWSSKYARAKGLRELGIAQLGSKGVVDDIQFVRAIAEKTIRILIPKIFRTVFVNNLVCLEAANRCEEEGAAYAAANAAAYAAAYAANYNAGDEYLLLSASLALEVLRDLKSPGVELL